MHGDGSFQHSSVFLLLYILRRIYKIYDSLQAALMDTSINNWFLSSYPLLLQDHPILKHGRRRRENEKTHQNRGFSIFNSDLNPVTFDLS
jgi:hypothetical protein